MEKDLGPSPPPGDEAKPAVTLLEPPGERETPVEEDPVPPLHERILGVLLAPVETFRVLDARWGWLGPWLAIAIVGCFAGAVRQSRTDLGGAMRVQQEHGMALMSDAQRRTFEMVPEDTRLMIARASVFKERIGDFASPTIGAIVEILVVGGIFYCAALTFGGKKELLKGVVVAAHAKTIALAGYLAFGIGAFLGNPLPSTTLEHATNELVHPVIATLLRGVDPIALWHTVVLGIGLHAAMGLRKRHAALVAATLHFALWFVHVVLAVLAAQAGSHS